MPTFTFAGFTDGAFVGLSAARGAQGSTTPVPEWRLSNMNTASLDIAQIVTDDLVAPCGIWFDAVNLSDFTYTEPALDTEYDPTAHNITYIWDFNDPGTFATPLNIPSFWNDKGTGYGKRTYHVFEKPGIYAVRVRAIDDQGITGERTISVTIRDPDEEYSGSRTICVSNTSDFTGAPSGAQQVTSLSAAQTAYRALGQMGRLLIRRGETYDESYVIAASQPNHRVGAFGTGVKPVMRPPYQAAGGDYSVFSTDFSGTKPDPVYSGLRFEGEWDAAKETGDGRGVGISHWGYAGNPTWQGLIHQCEFDGLKELLPDSYEGESRVAIVDCDITNWKKYGLASFSNIDYDNSRFAVVGCAIHQKVNACSGGQGQNGFGNEQGPIRISKINKVVLDCVDMYSACSWVGDPYHQPCARLFTSGGVHPQNFYSHASRVVGEGGNPVFSLDGENSFAEERPGNHVFDKMLVVGDYQTLDMFLINYGGVSARNILAVFPAVSRPGGTIGAFAAVVHPQDNSNSDNQNAAMDFYNWTFLNLYDYSVNTFNDGANFPNRALTNNINHQPNAGVTESAPIDIGTPISGFTPRNPGRRNSPTKVSASLSLANGATSGLIDYPAGTGQADYSSGGRHGVIFGDYVSAPHYYSYRDDCALTFEAGGFRVQNLSGGAWSGTATFNLDQSTLATETAYASPPTIPLPTPQVGSNALIAQTGRQSYLGFDTFARTVLARGAL